MELPLTDCVIARTKKFWRPMHPRDHFNQAPIRINGSSKGVGGACGKDSQVKLPAQWCSTQSLRTSASLRGEGGPKALVFKVKARSDSAWAGIPSLVIGLNFHFMSWRQSRFIRPFVGCAYGNHFPNLPRMVHGDIKACASCGCTIQSLRPDNLMVFNCVALQLSLGQDYRMDPFSSAVA